MILADWEIGEEIDQGNIIFVPLIDTSSQIQSASVDLRLSPNLRVPRNTPDIILSPRARIRPEYYGEESSILPNGYNLRPGDFVLGSTLEHIEIPMHLAGRLDGKSSLARVGLLIHFTSAHIAPGFAGAIVLEIVNLGKNTIALFPEMPICQVIFERMSKEPRVAYGGGFQGQAGP